VENNNRKHKRKHIEEGVARLLSGFMGGIDIPELREDIESDPEYPIEKTFYRTGGNSKPLTREEAIEFLRVLEAQGITSTSEIPNCFLDAMPIGFHFGPPHFRVAGNVHSPSSHQ
jgi:hypothetical protein